MSIEEKCQIAKEFNDVRSSIMMICGFDIEEEGKKVCEDGFWDIVLMAKNLDIETSKKHKKTKKKMSISFCYVVVASIIDSLHKYDPPLSDQAQIQKDFIISVWNVFLEFAMKN